MYVHRCIKESQLAVKLSHSDPECKVILAAVQQPSSRPDFLKRENFLYLDFIDKEKREYVWQKLTTTLS